MPSTHHWHQDRVHYTEQQIGQMPTLVKRNKDLTSQTILEHYQNVDLNSFNEMQSLTYKLVKVHSEDISANIEQRFLILISVAGTGKRYLINAIRSILQIKCAVTATTGKASFGINGVTIHSF